MSVGKIFPLLYKKSSKGKLQQWKIWTEDENIYSEHGYVDGKITQDKPTIAKGKNIGKANETTPAEQAQSQAESKWKKQLDKGYKQTIEECDELVLLPMLANSFDKRGHDIQYPAYVQPKYDGCLSYDTVIEFEDGVKRTIGDVVEKKIEGKIKCYNHVTKQVEYKNILNWMKNNKVDGIKWFEVETTDGYKMTLTGNHKVWVQSLNCYRRVDELKGDEILLID